MATDPVLHLVRDYYRGCVYCDDAEQGSEDFEHLTGDGPFFAGNDQVAIAVVNSRMADPGKSGVEPTVYAREAPVLQYDHVSVLALPSGRLAIGDADRCDEISLAPGRWSVRVDLDPPSFARGRACDRSPVPGRSRLRSCVGRPRGLEVCAVAHGKG